MEKEVIKLSATAMMRQAIPTLLKEQFKDGATFEELWNELLKNKNLGKLMINNDKKSRYGLLQGLTNRIKENKEDNIMLIKKENGKNYYIYYNNSLDKLKKYTNIYTNSIYIMKENNEFDLENEDAKKLEAYFNTLKKLEILVDNVSSNS